MDYQTLMKFCEESGWINRIGRPWLAEGKVYATNGKIILRLPGQVEGVTKNKDAPDVNKLFSEHPFPSDGWHSLPYLPAPEYEECPPCNGTGKWKPEGKEISCDNCGGKGRWEVFQYFEIDGIFFQLALLRLLKDNLTGLEISVNPEIDRPSWIRFDGGDGLVMPCRRP